MTALEYFEQQHDRHQRNYNRAVLKGATEEELQNIKRKIGYYSQTAEALKLDKDYVSVVRCKNCVYYKDFLGEMMCHLWIDLLTTKPDDYCSSGERRSK